MTPKTINISYTAEDGTTHQSMCHRFKGEQSERLDIDLLSRKPISYTHENGAYGLQWSTIK